MIRSSTNKSLRYLVLAFSMVILAQLIFGVYVYAFENRMGGISLSMSALCSLVAILPFVLGLRKFDLFSPLCLFAAALTLGSMLRVAYVFSYQDSNSRANFLLFGSSFEELTWSSFYVFFGVISFVIGYLINTKRVRLNSLITFSSFDISEKRLFLVAVVFGVFGAVMGAIFLSKAGIDISAGLLKASAKAFISYEGTDGAVSVGTGFERFLAKFAEFPFVVICCLLMIKEVKRKQVAIVLCCCLAIPVLLIPFLYSSRSAVVLSFITIIIFAYYFGKVTVTQIVVGVITIICVITVMGQLRFENKTQAVQQRTVMDAFIGSGNGIDFIRTAGIIDRVAEDSRYLHGKTYSYVFAIFIPRAFWSSKPEIGLGPYIKSEIFNGREVDKNGWPSGMIGEAYLNFGLMGVFLGMALYGWLASLVYNTFRPHLGVSYTVTFLYAFIAWRFGFGLPGLNLAHGLSQVLTIMIPALLFLYLVRTKRVRIPTRFTSPI